MEWLFYPLLLQFGIFTSNAKLHSEDDVYTTSSSTTYSNIPSGCSLFGSKFETNDFDHILNVKENKTYWIGAKIGFKQNINPLGVQNKCNGNQSGSLEECNRHCKGWKYFSYNVQSCNCLKSNKNHDGLAQTQTCENPENGICFINKCIIYERNVLDKDYICGARKFEKKYKSWIFTTQKCSKKMNFICDGDRKPSDSKNITRSWLEAEHVCSKREQKLIQTENINDLFKDGRQYWISFFRQNKISWGIDTTKTVCVAARIQSNGSYQLKTHFCSERLEALCHNTNHTKYGLSEADIMTASLGSVLGGVLVCVVVVAATKNRCKRHLQNVKTNEQPLEDFKKGSTSTDGIMNKYIDEPMYSNTDVPLDDSAVNALAKDHSDPSNNIEVQDKQYDRVSYMEQRNTDADKFYGHIMEDPYQNPYS